jgi:hypothetical protein
MAQLLNCHEAVETRGFQAFRTTKAQIAPASSIPSSNLEVGVRIGSRSCMHLRLFDFLSLLFVTFLSICRPAE